MHFCFQKHHQFLNSLPFKQLIFFCAFLAIAQITVGQKNIATAILVNVEGDTLQGVVNNKDWINNPKEIKFKGLNDAEFSSYSPDQITSFITEGNQYISAEVALEVSPRITNELDYKKELNLVQELVFLRVLFEGSKSLYFHKSKEESIENFYIKEDGKIVLLEYKKYLKYVGEKKTEAELKNYLAQLNSYLVNCPSTSSMLLQTKYKLSAISKLFATYYADCATETFTFKQEKEKVNISGEVFAGISNTTLTFKSDNYDFLVEGDFSSSLDYSFGVGVEFNFPRFRNKISQVTELMYTTFDITGEYNNFTSEDQFQISNTNFAFSHLKLALMVKYIHFLPKSRLYIHGGVSNGFVLSEKNERKIEEQFFSQYREETTDAILFTRQYELGGIIGVGWEKNRWGINARYEKGNGISSVLSLYAGTNRLYLLVKYRFLQFT